MLNKYGILKKEFNLKNHNTYKIESICKYFIIVNNINNLKELIKYLQEKNIKYFIIGNGSNIILPMYYDGVVIKLDLNEINYNKDILEVGASLMLNKIALDSVSKGYKGLEWASGIPGTVGGSTVNNSGSFGSEIFDYIIKLDVLKDNKIITLNKEDINYSYRCTNLKKYIILKVYFKLEKGNKEKLLSLIQERTEKRKASQPNKPSAGSVFRNPEGDYAGRLIEESGLKGREIGGAKISNKHANFIVNNKNATSNDIITLINLIKVTIKEKYNIDLILEQEIIK